MSSSSLRNSSLFCSALLCSSLSHPSLTFFTLLYSARLCSTLRASVCHQVAAGKGPSWPLAQHLRGLGAQSCRMKFALVLVMIVMATPHHRGSGTSANQVRFYWPSCRCRWICPVDFCHVVPSRLFDLNNFNKHSLRRVDEERRFDAFWALEPTPALQHGRQAVRREHCLDPQKKSERVQPRMRFHSVAIAPSHTPAVACNNQTYDCMRPLSLENTCRAGLPEKLHVASWESEAMVVCCERW